MRISRDTILSTFTNLAKEKEEDYLKRYPKPTPPTTEEILAALRKGEFRPASAKCKCEIRESKWGGYVDRFRIEDMVRLPIIETYKRKADAHRKRVEAFMAKVTIRRKEDVTYCLYGPGQTEKGAFYAKAQEFKKWTP